MIASNKKIVINFDHIVLFVLLFTSVDTVLFGTNTSFALRLVPRIVGLLSCFYFFVKLITCKDRVNIGRLFVVYSLLIILYFLSCFINQVSLDGILSRFISITTGFLLVSYFDKNTFFNAFKKIVFIISCVALISELFVLFFPNFFNIFPTIYNTNNHPFKTFFIGSVDINSINQTVPRMQGIFWEPGAFAIYIVIALCFELFSKKKNLVRIIIDAICLIFTVSTTGYIAFAFCLVVYALFAENKGHRRLNAVLLVFSVLALLFLLLYSGGLMANAFGKILDKNSSAGTRFSSLFNGTRLIFQRPLFGWGENGTDGMKVLLSTSDYWYNNGGTIITNTVIGYAATYGLPFGIIMIIGSYRFFSCFSNKKIVIFMLFVVLMICYFGERFFSFLPFAILFYGFKTNKAARKVTIKQYESFRTEFVR